MKMAVLVDEVADQKGLVFLMHGFLDLKEHPLLTLSARLFKEKVFTTVLFDATNSLGESEGKMENATMTGYLEDLEDVIAWAKEKRWYFEHFFLVGHSVGGYCVANYATRNEKVKGLILFSPKVLGEIIQKTSETEVMMEECKKKGFFEWESLSTPGCIKRKGYDYFIDGKNHNLLNIAGKIKCPVLMIGGDADEVIPIEDQNKLFDKIESKKELHIIRGGDHNLKGSENSKELIEIINNWIE